MQRLGDGEILDGDLLTESVKDRDGGMKKRGGKCGGYVGERGSDMPASYSKHTVHINKGRIHDSDNLGHTHTNTQQVGQYAYD